MTTQTHTVELYAVMDADDEPIHFTDDAELAASTLKLNPGAYIEMAQIEVDDEGMPV